MTKPYKVDPTPVVVKTYKDGSVRYHSDACPKCGGVGYLPGYEFIDGARCWKCGDTGYYPHEWVEKSEERVQKENEKRLAKLKAQAPEKNKAFLKANGFSKDGKTYLVLGDTYSVKDDLKKIGGKFDYIMGWHIPEDSIDYETIDVDINDVAYKNDIGEWVFKPIGDIDSFVKEVKEEHKKAKMPKRDSKNSEYVGNVGDKITVKATLKKEYTYETNYGYYGGSSTIYNFEDEDGNILVWNTSSMPYVNDRPIETGKKYEITGTVKDHKEYKGEKETVLIRCKIKEG